MEKEEREGKGEGKSDCPPVKWVKKKRTVVRGEQDSADCRVERRKGDDWSVGQSRPFDTRPGVRGVRHLAFGAAEMQVNSMIAAPVPPNAKPSRALNSSMLRNFPQFMPHAVRCLPNVGKSSSLAAAFLRIPFRPTVQHCCRLLHGSGYALIGMDPSYHPFILQSPPLRIFESNKDNLMLPGSVHAG